MKGSNAFDGSYLRQLATVHMVWKPFVAIFIFIYGYRYQYMLKVFAVQTLWADSDDVCKLPNQPQVSKKYGKYKNCCFLVDS